MRERARLAEGRLEIISRPLEGTTIRLQLPGNKGGCGSMNETIRVMIVDDHLVVREGLR